MTQVQRVISTFTAPSKTFKDIKRSTAWWLPFLLVILFSYLFFAAITTKIGWSQVADNNAHMNAKQAEQLDKLPPDARANQLKVIGYFIEGSFAATPILALLFQAIIAGVLLATINFGFGGKARFAEVWAVCWFAGLPGLLKYLLGSIALFVGIEPENFRINNFDGTNIGYYLPADTSKPLLALATSLDAVTIWAMVLMGLGLSIVAGTKRSAGYTAVFAWWAIITIGSVGFSAIF